MDFADDPFKDYRYEDPFNIEDPFSDVTDAKKDPFGRPTSVAGFETDDFFASSLNNGFAAPEKRSGRVSAPPVAYDPFATRSDPKPSAPAKPTKPSESSDSWAAWPNDNWADDDAWAKPDNANKKTENTDRKIDNWANKSDNWANKSDNWATDWSSDRNGNMNETWPSTLPSKKEKSPRPVKYAKSLVHTIGGIGRARGKDKKKVTGSDGKSEGLPSEEQQWAWASAESKRLQAEADARRRQEDQELQLALALSRQER